MLGNLYIIKNTVNDKVYIGKTYNTIEQRFKEHKKNARRGIKNKFYNAIRKYGKDNFYIELIGQFEEGILEEKEIEYIAKYDSYHNGYNSTLGGGGWRQIELNEEEIIIDYKNGLNIAQLATKHGVSTDTISKFLVNKNLHTIDSEKNQKIRLVMYDKYWVRVKEFDSRRESSNYVKDELKMSVPREFCQKIDNACKNGNIAYKHHWQKTDELFVGEMEFNTVWDKEDYLSGENMELVDGVYWSTKRIIELQNLKEKDKERINILKRREENRIIKNIQKSVKKDKEILKTKKEKKKEKIIKQSKEKTTSTKKEKDKKETQKSKTLRKEINPDEIKELLKTNSAEEVSRMFNVTSKTIRKICKKHGFPTPHEIRKQYMVEMYFLDIINLFNSGDSTHTISIKLKISEDLIKEIIKNAPNTRARNAKPQMVEQYTLDGEYINTFISMREASRRLGENIQPHKIAMCLDGRRKSAYGYIWKTKDKCV